MRHFLEDFDITACGRGVMVNNLSVTGEWFEVTCERCKSVQKIRPVMQGLLSLTKAERMMLLCWFCCDCGEHLGPETGGACSFCGENT